MELELLKYLAASGVTGVVAALAMWFAVRKDKAKDDQQAKSDIRFDAQGKMFAEAVQGLVTDFADRHAAKDAQFVEAINQLMKQFAEQLSEMTQQMVELVKSAHDENRLLAEQFRAVAEVLQRKNTR